MAFLQTKENMDRWQLGRHSVLMLSETRYEFAPGKRYENRKGPFEVVSVNGDVMEIRWDNGEQVVTSVEFQSKILRNIEREMTVAPARSGKSYRAPDWFGGLFRGLQEDDFREGVEGTHWRSREQLGGAVSKGVLVREPFNSWAIYRRPEVLWTTVRRHAQVETVYQTKFFARIWPEHILFGLYLERADEPAKPRQDWDAFLQWLREACNATWLHETLNREQAFLGNPYADQPDQAFYGTIQAVSAGFELSLGRDRQLTAPSGLSHFFTSRPEGKWLNLVIARKIPKGEAIKAGAQFAKTVYDFFNLMLPIFENRQPAG